MSKIGKQSISLPSNVKIFLDKSILNISGPHGIISIKTSDAMKIIFHKSHLNIKPILYNKKTNILWGTTYSIIKNIIIGVRNKFNKVLLLNGLGYNARVKKDFLMLKLGYSHNIIYHIPNNIKIFCKNENSIQIEGSNKYLVGQISSDIRSLRKIDPYQCKGIKYVNELICVKVGKKK